MSGFTRVEQGESTYLSYELGADQSLDGVAYEMLTGNEIPGLIVPILNRFDTSVKLQYDITGLTSLNAMLEDDVNKDMILTLFKSIVEAIEDASDYLLLSDSYVLDPEQSFIAADNKARLVYLPVVDAKEGMKLDRFLRLVIASAHDSGEYGYIGSILSYLNGGSFTVTGFKELLDGLARGTVASAPRHAAPTQPQRPAQPSQPVQPVQPVQPQKPVQPAQPVPPMQPQKPAQPIPPQQNGYGYAPAQNLGAQPVQNGYNYGVQQNSGPMGSGVQNPISMTPPAGASSFNIPGAPNAGAVPGPGGFNIPGGPGLAPEGGKEKKGGLFGGKGNPDKEAKKAAKEAEKAAKEAEKAAKKAAKGGKTPGFTVPFGNKDAGAQPSGPMGMGSGAMVGGMNIPGVQQDIKFDTSYEQGWQQNYQVDKSSLVDDSFGATVDGRLTGDLGFDAEDSGTLVADAAPVAPAGPMGYLIREKDGSRIDLPKRDFVIGRSHNKSDYAITDNPEISKAHIRISSDGYSYFIEDLNSLNRTFIDGRDLLPGKKEVLRAGTQVKLSSDVFTFYLG